jgi:hypothetical protein
MNSKFFINPLSVKVPHPDENHNPYWFAISVADLVEMSNFLANLGINLVILG